ncbi:hypothetical protein ACKRZS_002891, partial [Fusarium odoratissimum]
PAAKVDGDVIAVGAVPVEMEFTDALRVGCGAAATPRLGKEAIDTGERLEEPVGRVNFVDWIGKGQGREKEEGNAEEEQEKLKPATVGMHFL